MSEIVIVISDLYLPPDTLEVARSVHAIGVTGRSATAASRAESPGAAAAGATSRSGAAASHAERPAAAVGATQATQGASPLAGLEHIARYGHRRTLEAEGGWRPWLARALSRADLADIPPAIVVAQSPSPPAPAAATDSPSRQAPAAAIDSPSPPVPTAATDLSAPSAPMARTAWLATPLHLIPSLTTVHLDRRSLLRLSSAEAEGFATDFNQTFRDPDPAASLQLHPLPSGEFLLEAPASFEATTTEPARALVVGLESSLPRGPRATTFKRLGAELEMWLHAHPLNEARRRRGELPSSTLWLWGGGPFFPVQTSSAQSAPRVIAYGNDPYLVGLATLSGATIRKLPDSLADETDPVSRVVLVSEVTPRLHANPHWTVVDAVADIDRRFLSPALTALNTGRVETVTLIANNLEVQLRRSDRLKFWRPRQSGLTGLIPR